MKATRIRLGVLIAAVACTLGLAAPASAATTDTAQHKAIRITSQHFAPMTTLTSQAAPACAIGGAAWESRTESCQQGQDLIRFIDLDTGNVDGTATLQSSTHTTLDPANRNRNVVEVQARIVNPTIWVAEFGEMNVSESCSSCRPSATPTRFMWPGSIQTFNMIVRSPGKKAIREDWTPTFSYQAPLYSRANGPLAFAETTRCDSTSGMGNGCVFPKVKPVYNVSTTSTRSAQVAWHILWAQHNLKHHWGWQGHGQPLTRTMNQWLIEHNRDTACPESRPRPQGKSCDEYPFASTYQGAYLNPDYSWHMLNAVQNRLEGRDRQTWYGSVRLWAGDQFWVNVVLPPSLSNNPAAAERAAEAALSR